MDPSAAPSPAKPARLTPMTAIFLIVFVDILGFTIILPLLPFYAEKFGASPEVIGALMASYGLCQLISGPFLGRWSDRLGRKPLLIVSQIGTCAGFLLLAYSHTLALVFLARIIDGLTAGNISLAQAFISDITPPEKRAQSFGKIGIAFGLGFLIGPSIAGWLSRFGYNAPMLAAAALSFTSIMATTFLLPANISPKKAPGGGKFKIIDFEGFANAIERPGLAVLLARFFCFALAFSFYVSGFALFAARQLLFDDKPFGPSEVAYVFAFSGFLGIIIQGGLMGRLVNRFGERVLAAFGFVSMAVGYAALSLASGIGTALAAVTFSSMGSSVTRPVMTSLVSRTAGRHEQGMILGLTQSLQSIAQVIAPLLAGFLIGKNWMTAWAITAGAIALLGFLLGIGAGSKNATTQPHPG